MHHLAVRSIPKWPAIVDAAVDRLEAAGAIVERITLPGENLLDLFHHHCFTGAAARLSAISPDQRSAIDPGFLEIARDGAAYTSTELVTAQVCRADFGAAMDRLLSDFDSSSRPELRSQPSEVPANGSHTRWTEWAGFSFPINLSQQPACVIP